MYVKVVPDDRSAPSLFQTPPGVPVEYGSHICNQNPANVDNWEDELGVALSFLYVRGEWGEPHTIIAPQPEDPDDAEFWQLAYAWWSLPNDLPVGVVTVGRIYLLGEDGKTIDRA